MNRPPTNASTMHSDDFLIRFRNSGLTSRPGSVAGVVPFGMGDLDHVEIPDRPEIGRVDGVQRQSTTDRDSRDKRVVRSGASLASYASQIGRYLAKGSSGPRIERQGFEIRLGLLEMRLSCGSLRLRSCNQGANGQFSKGYAGNRWRLGQVCRSGQTREHDHGAGVQ